MSAEGTESLILTCQQIPPSAAEGAGAMHLHNALVWPLDCFDYMDSGGLGKLQILQLCCSLQK